MNQSDSTLDGNDQSEPSRIGDSVDYKNVFTAVDDSILIVRDHTLFENFENAQTRKQERIASIKLWEEKRVQMCSIFTGIVERLNASLIRTGQDSQWSFNQVIQFLRNRVLADLKYSTSKMAQLKELYDLGEHKVLRYGKLHIALDAVEQYTAAELISLNEAAQLLETEMITLLVRSLREFEQRLSEYHVLCTQLKKRYQSTYDISIAKHRQYLAIFDDTMKSYQKPNFNRDDIKDLALTEIEYLQHVDQHYNAMKTFGKESLEFYNEMREMEKHRIENISRAFSYYQEYLKQRLVMAPYDEEQVVEWDFSDVNPEEEIHDTFDIVAQLEPQEIAFIKKVYEIEEVTFDVFSQYVGDFKLPQVKERPLLVKEVKAQRLVSHSDQPTWQDCTILLTLDRNVFVVDGHESYYRAPTFKFRIYAGCCTYTSNELVLFENQCRYVCFKRRVEHRFRGNPELEEFHTLIKNN